MKTEFIVFRSPPLGCDDLSGLSLNVLKGEIIGCHIRPIHLLYDHITAICRSTYFHIRNIGKSSNLLSYNACSTIIHALLLLHYYLV